MGKNDVWLDQVREEALEPDLRICDCHHHLWGQRDRRAVTRYLLDDFLADIDTGHNIVSTVYVDSHAIYREEGPEAMKPVGEIEFANGIAAMSASGLYGGTQVAAGIVGHADMRLGSEVGAVLDAMIAAAPDRFRGIRHCTTFDDDERVPRHRDSPVPGLLLDDTFRAGCRELEKRGLVFEAFCWHTQLPELSDLARALPNLAIVSNHCGSPLGVGPYAGKREEVTALWRKNLAELARCGNVVVKLGGVNMMIVGHGWHERDAPPTSDEMLAAAGPYLDYTIECFGTDRGMFQSNYPAERISCGYGPLWNFFKKVTRDFSDAEKAKLFHDNAAAFYRLPR